jgi:hypothetical protein
MPRLLATPPNTLRGTLLKPGFMSFDESLQGRTAGYLEGPGETGREFAYGPNVGIVWTRWGARAAGRILAYAWCFAKQPTPCVPP